MAFVAPKLNWQTSDYYEVADWNRVKGNLQWIYDWMVARGVNPTPLNDVTLARGADALPFYDFVNLMESNLEKVYNSFGVPFSAWSGRKTWHARLSENWVANPNNVDFIRWELLTQLCKECIDYLDTYLYQRVSATFCAGEFRTVQHFSRGRTF